MSNIYEYLAQTLSVSAAALFLLILKRCFADKLSPRWQYGVWSLLALRILLPIDVSRNILLPIPLWIESFKSAAEAGIDSAWSGVYRPISLRHILPAPDGLPQSLSDWLFLVYAIGVMAMLISYAVRYGMLRNRLRRGRPLSPHTAARMETLCEVYGLKACRAVEVRGLKTAFVCGWLRPVLVLPEDTPVEDKILLHELLHLHYHDAAQNLFWCILRALHWCNPFLHFVFDRIGNDLESLCDQRVLERLDGEERRAYGAILLSMASEKYARMPATSSISNGGRNVARRIEAIVRFKQFPRGMALVSVCMTLVLAFPILAGTQDPMEGRDLTPDNPAAFARSMAMTRLNRCTTAAGALDTWAKGILWENGLFLAAASPIERQEALEAQMREQNNGAYGFLIDSGSELSMADTTGGYWLFNLEEHPDGRVSALLAFRVIRFPDGVSPEMDRLNAEIDSRPLSVGYVLFCVEAAPTPDGYAVTEIGERSLHAAPQEELSYENSGIPMLFTLEETGETGRVRVDVRTVHWVDDDIRRANVGLDSNVTFPVPMVPDADFSGHQVWTYAKYFYGENPDGALPEQSAGLQIIRLDSPEDSVDFPPPVEIGPEAWGSSSSSSGYASAFVRVSGDPYGCVMSGSGSGDRNSGSEWPLIPHRYAIRVFRDGKAAEDFLLEYKEDADA